MTVENKEVENLMVELDDLFETPFVPKKKKAKVRHIDEWNIPAPYVPKWNAVGVTMRVVRQICSCGEGHYRQTGLFVHYKEERGAEKWSRTTKAEITETRFRELDHFTEITEEKIDVCMCCFEAGSVTVHSDDFDQVCNDLDLGPAEDDVSLDDLMEG